MREAAKVREQRTGHLGERQRHVGVSHNLLLQVVSIQLHAELVGELDVNEERSVGAVGGGVHVSSVSALAFDLDHLELLLGPHSLEVDAVALQRDAAGARSIEVHHTEVTSVDALLVKGVHTARVSIPHVRGVDLALVVESGDDVTGLRADLPLEARDINVVQKTAEESADRRNGLQDAGSQRVLGVGQHQEALGAGHLSPPLISVVGLLELVHASVDHHLGHDGILGARLLGGVRGKCGCWSQAAKVKWPNVDLQIPESIQNTT